MQSGEWLLLPCAARAHPQVAPRFAGVMLTTVLSLALLAAEQAGAAMVPEPVWAAIDAGTDIVRYNRKCVVRDARDCTCAARPVSL